MGWLRVKRTDGQSFVLEDKSPIKEGFVWSGAWDSKNGGRITVFKKEIYTPPNYVGFFKKTDLEIVFS